MQRLRIWLRPPRNLLILFLAVVALPAATLVALGVRLLEQDRALIRQRQTEILERAGDRSVSALEQNFALWIKRLADPTWVSPELPEDSVYVLLRANRVQARPSGRLPYYPLAQSLKEAPAEPFRELESQEFRTQNLASALELSRKLAASPDVSLQPGALLRQARILRKMGRHEEALQVYKTLGHFTAVAISGYPADLLARRTGCALLEELARHDELRREAAALATDLRAGRWQLDRPSYLHVTAQLGHWLGSESRASPETEALAAAVAWLYDKWSSAPPDQFSSTGIQSQSFDGVLVTILWASGEGRVVAFVAGPRYFQNHWLADVQQAARPAKAYLLAAGGKAVIGDPPPADARKVQRAAADTGLPWSVVVTGAAPAEEYGALMARRRTLLVGFAAILVLIFAGSYLIWRSVNREMAVAQLQSEFVSAVSHEFRTPLTALRQFNELLEEDETLSAEKRRSYHQAQARATERLQRFVESLLDFGRMEAGRRPYRFERLDAAALAHDVVEDFRHEVKERGFVVECRTDSGQYPVDADSEALAHAVWNLLDNAAKYSGGGRQIELTVSRADNEVAIAVRDHGLGIPAAEQKLIFQKFVRGTAAKLLGVKGTGIGLAMVEHIVRAHGGRVEVKSSPGEGSTFTIVLPAKE
jgi:two-component system phosphate regulon sensor histidine kinase PhoR